MMCKAVDFQIFEIFNIYFVAEGGLNHDSKE